MCGEQTRNLFFSASHEFDHLMNWGNSVRCSTYQNLTLSLTMAPSVNHHLAVGRTISSCLSTVMNHPRCPVCLTAPPIPACTISVPAVVAGVFGGDGAQAANPGGPAAHGGHCQQPPHHPLRHLGHLCTGAAGVLPQHYLPSGCTGGGVNAKGWKRVFFSVLPLLF